MIVHVCAPGADPRHQDTCLKCGRPLPVAPAPTAAVKSTRERVQRWLAAGMRVLPTYEGRVMARHEHASAEYGDSWKERSPHALTLEVGEEGLDVGGWAMLVGERLDQLHPSAQAEAAIYVRELCTLGAQVVAKADRLAALCAHETRYQD